MEYSKLLLALCLFVALIKAIPIPPSEPSIFLEENGVEEVGVEEEFAQVTEIPFDNEQEETTEIQAAEPVDEPIFIDAEADQEPQDISTDTNNVVAENIGNITNDVLGSVSYSVKTALEEELGTETNDSATNNIVNDVVIDLLTKTSEEIKTAVGSILENDIENTDFQTIASDAAEKVAEILGHNVVTSIASNLDINIDYENIAKNVLSSTTESVQDFIKKSLDTSKAVVDQTMTNESSDDLAISNANDIATMVTNGVSYLIKSTLCESVDNELGEVCENLTNDIIISAAGILNEIISSNIKAAYGNGLTVSCSAIPSEVFEKLTGVIVNSIGTQIGSSDADNISKIANSILTVIINSIEDLLCANRADASENGSVLLKDITGIATHIINKVNNINDDVVSTLNDEKEQSNVISGSIANGISEIQETLKEEVEA
ncbi:hypothetical protein BCR36DRAFT_586706 [Piromyces finnis]|uniref:Uncharacterized protein n=1 Tax=Piromyces finnis TaxID=1754191 RepID=A0A1Y1UZK3_9FUNG|nr:hypothetical protein BCR36DRAFT_586706 [Piromyces finnis]|eukprot:ORX43428.1 hypothetical protein BCR36DRAFT_586706 [Piromyces finnis]